MMAARRFYPLLISLLSLIVLSVVLLVIRSQGYWLSYQVSASMPKGFYWITLVHGALHRNEIVVFQPPKQFKEFLTAHHWLPDDGIMMKHVIGMPGDWVCKRDDYIWLNHHVLAPIFSHAPKGERLPELPFCQTLLHNQYLLMSLRVPNSFDGRYFGPVVRQRVIGRAIGPL